MGVVELSYARSYPTTCSLHTCTLTMKKLQHQSRCCSCGGCPCWRRWRKGGKGRCTGGTPCVCVLGGGVEDGGWGERTVTSESYRKGNTKAWPRDACTSRVSTCHCTCHCNTEQLHTEQLQQGIVVQKRYTNNDPMIATQSAERSQILHFTHHVLASCSQLANPFFVSDDLR